MGQKSKGHGVPGYQEDADFNSCLQDAGTLRQPLHTPFLAQSPQVGELQSSYTSHSLERRLDSLLHFLPVYSGHWGCTCGWGSISSDLGSPDGQALAKRQRTVQLARGRQGDPQGRGREWGFLEAKNLGGGKSTDRSSETKPGNQRSADTGLCGIDLVVENGGKDNQKRLETL